MFETRTAAHVVCQGGESIRQEGASACKEYERERDKPVWRHVIPMASLGCKKGAPPESPSSPHAAS